MVSSCGSFSRLEAYFRAYFRALLHTHKYCRVHCKRLCRSKCPPPPPPQLVCTRSKRPPQLVCTIFAWQVFVCLSQVSIGASCIAGTGWWHWCVVYSWHWLVGVFCLQRTLRYMYVCAGLSSGEGFLYYLL